MQMLCATAPVGGPRHDPAMADKSCEYILTTGADCGRRATQHVYAKPSQGLLDTGMVETDDPRPFFACAEHGVALASDLQESGFVIFVRDCSAALTRETRLSRPPCVSVRRAKELVAIRGRRSTGSMSEQSAASCS